MRLREQNPWQAVRGRLGIPPEAKVLTFATQNFLATPAMARELISLFAPALAEQHLYVVVKMHPAERHDFYARAGKELGLSRLRVVQRSNTQELLAASDIAMTMFSTVGLEALVLEKPLLVLDSAERRDEIQYVEPGAAIPVRNGRELQEAVRSILTDDAFREQLLSRGRAVVQHYASSLDGRATVRSVAKLYEMIEAAKQEQHTSR